VEGVEEGGGILMSKEDPSLDWTTEDEFSFLREYILHNQSGFMKYRELILRDKRRWDSTVDVGRVKRFLLGI